MKTLRCILAMIALLCGISCDKDDTEVGGMKKIGLSTYEIRATGEDETYTVNTESEGWGIWYIATIINGDTTLYENSLEPYYDENHHTETGLGGVLPTTFGIEGISLTKSADKQLQVVLSENSTGKTREWLVALTGVGMIDRDLYITQATK